MRCCQAGNRNSRNWGSDLSIDQEGELRGLRRVGAVVARTIALMRRLVKPGITTGEIDDSAAGYMRSEGARSAPQLAYRFPGATCISVNDEAVHGIPGQRVLRNGDLITLDVTAELDGFFADAAITIPVGNASARALQLCAAAESAFWKAANIAQAGTQLSLVGRAVETEVKAHGFRVMRELCGHGIGRAIHERPEVLNYYEPSNRVVLQRGLVIALEPIIASGNPRIRLLRDGWTVCSEDGSLTAHFEHTIVITRHRPLILTAA